VRACVQQRVFVAVPPASRPPACLQPTCLPACDVPAADVARMTEQRPVLCCDKPLNLHQVALMV
jgi:hypothetical protein